MDRSSRMAQQWHRENVDFDPEPMVLLGRLIEVKLVISRDKIHPLFFKNNVQPGEFDVLATLRRSGAPYKLTPTELYESTLITSGSMTNRLNRLEKAGLVKRIPNHQDRRGLFVQLTEKGLLLINEMIIFHVKNVDSALSCLSKKEQQELSYLLGKLLAGNKTDE